jgi:colicin import membrane protein
MNKTGLKAVLALVAGLLLSGGVAAQNDPKAAAAAAKEAAAKAKAAAKEAAVEKAKADAKKETAEKAEAIDKKVEKAKVANANANEAAMKAEDEANAKIWGQIERLDQIATATSNKELADVVTRLKDKATKRHDAMAAPAKK